MNIDQAKLAAELREIQQRDAERTAQANLDPCRCGAAPRLIDREGGPLIQGAFIQCDACGMSTGIKPTATEAIACWQPAAATAAQPVLPDIETVSAEVHEAWMDSKRLVGVTSRKSESGEELMVPYAQLSEGAKELDRNTVRAVYAAILSCPKGDLKCST